MRAFIQRVSEASVSIDGQEHAAIGRGLLILLGVAPEDDESDIAWLSRKIIGMRLFSDDAGKMNLSLSDIGGQALVISQFTLFASTRKGNRPSFIAAADPAHAERCYHGFIEALAQALDVASGVFAAEMQVALCNDGPVSIWIDSRNRE